MKETFGSVEPTPAGGLARSSRHGSPRTKTTASIRATTGMADILGYAMASAYRAVAFGLPRSRSRLDPRNHRPGKPGNALYRRIGWSQFHRSYAGHQSFMDWDGRATQATRIQ